MPLTPGSMLGPYQIVAPLGAGGMGEVYRARDTRLDRNVAVKILPAHLSSSPEVRARFEREARSVSSLNHPHICTLYDVGKQDGIDFLVMEHLEGETLAERIERGPLPLGEALRCAVEIADALDRAHRTGIVHRDLKPGNVMLTKSGSKLLDFGLARATGLSSADPGHSQSPTMSRPLTAEGTIVGTFQYMSPEQLEGREADARSDIFSFGAVLYEMASGRRAFEGKSQASLIAAILKEQPRPVSELCPTAPPALDRVVRQCLEKDPDERWQTAGDLGRELKWISGAAGVEGARELTPTVEASKTPRGRRERLWKAAAAALAATVVLLAVVLVLPRRTAPATIMRFSIPQTEVVSWRPWNSMALSPDGRQLVFYADGAEGIGRFWLRSLDSLEIRPLSGTDIGNASFPFWSPDSRSIGFFSAGKLRRLDIAGGRPVALCDAPDARGGTWNKSGTILFSPAPGTGLMRIAASGGTAVQATHAELTREAGGHQWPAFLPDGEHFTYLAAGTGKDDSWIWAGALGSGDPKRLVGAESGALYADPGYLLLARGGILVAQPLDAGRLEAVGDPVQIVEEISRNTDTFYTAFTVSKSGILAYKSGADLQRQLGIFDRTGQLLRRFGPLGDIGNPSLSPDGKRVAVDRVEPNAITSDIWVIDLGRGTGSRLTFEPGSERTPAWSPDGSRVYYDVGPEGIPGIYDKAASGATPGELLIKLDRPLSSLDASRDGKYLAYSSSTLTSTNDIWVLPLQGERTPVPFLQTPNNESHVRISPDSRWIAYDSDESGRTEVYVQTFPRPLGKWQISTTGGAQPTWRADGKEIFFLGLDRTVMSASIATNGATLEVGTPEPVFKIDLTRLTVKSRYTAMPDGKHFLTADPVGPVGSTASITVVLNWTADLPRK